MGKLEELLLLAKNVPGSYDYFVMGVEGHMHRHPENMDAVIAYIKEDPTRDSSDVLGYIWDLEGYDLAPLEIVDDEDDSEWEIAQERIA